MSERGEYGRRADALRIDLSLLLYVRGATAREAAESAGLTEAQWRRQVTGLGQGWRDAKRARWLTPHGTETRHVNGGCDCWDCVAAARDAGYRRAGLDPEQVKPKPGTVDKREMDRWREEARYRASLPGAVRHRRAWTGPELEIAARDDLSVAEKAGMLGRTTHSVKNMMWKIEREPKYRNLAGLAGRTE